MSILDALILIMVPQVRLMIFSLKMEDYSTSFMLKSYGVVVGGGGGLQHFSVSPRPLGFGFWG